jgi:hypothetical protein
VGGLVEERESLTCPSSAAYKRIDKADTGSGDIERKRRASALTLGKRRTAQNMEQFR